MLNGQYFYQFAFKYILAVSTYRTSNNSAAASQDTAKYDNAAIKNLYDLDVI